MISILLFISVTAFLTLLFVILFSTFFQRKIQLEKRIASLVENTVQDSIREKGKQAADSSNTTIKKDHFFKSLIKNIISAEKYRELDKRLINAGRPNQLKVEDLVLLQGLLGLGLFTVVLFLLLPNGENRVNVFFFATVLGAIGVYLPLYYIKGKTNQRIIQIQKMMPDFFDMLNLSVEAGLGLDAAIKKVSMQVNGPLAYEFLQLLDDIKLGKTKKQAMQELRDRVPLESFQGMINAIIQADQMGISMTKVLRAQTIRMRESMRQRSKELAMKAPIKMLIPMVIFIFPTLFIVLLGPIVIKLITDLL
ncbi:type II secretion system F family protein [Evansella sp. AB-P1]|uniref:type II secretion system F family protein n=1 Tax=Evansella sp. AB-P1 TaxID=3037653 RepID=UPI00241DEBBB|nr:type II secretion system F family protein [Evansella sp. AB-P1]MDG5788466.1 type II secretion system F family protein [Evansella sp. AB-P1]